MSASTTARAGSRARACWQELMDALFAPLLRPWRTLLVFIAYALGAAALTGAIAITQSTTGSVVERLTQAASQEVRVIDTRAEGQPWTMSDPTAKNSWATQEKVAAQLRTIEGVTDAIQVRRFTPVSNHISRLSMTLDRHELSRASSIQVYCTTQRYLTSRGASVAIGQLSLLNSTTAASVVLGSAAAASLNIATVGPDLTISLNGRAVSVAAILRPAGDPVLDSATYFSPGTLPILADQLDATIFVSTQTGYAEPVAKAIPLALAPTEPGKISVAKVSNLAKLQQGINSDLAQLMSIVGLVILILSALTAGTTMFLSVNHRYPEIALRRAMGASRFSIARLFLYEGLAIGTAGGIVGTALGVAVAWFAAKRSHWPLCIGWQTVVLGCIIGFLTGIVASLIPAIHAARRDPAGVLRSA